MFELSEADVELLFNVLSDERIGAMIEQHRIPLDDEETERLAELMDRMQDSMEDGAPD
jgi:hypothetical protein